MTAVIAGTGRSGTKWLTKVFNELGHPAAHEHHCGSYGMEHYISTGQMRSDWGQTHAIESALHAAKFQTSYADRYTLVDEYLRSVIRDEATP